jgi:hypothetical protein
MLYALLIYGDETSATGVSAEAMKTMAADYWAYEEWLAEKGIKRAGEALHPTDRATTVRSREGRDLTTDGPFAETKEQLGGFYLLECDNLDDALEAARRCPGSRHGSIEVRPVLEFVPPEGSA